MKSDVIRQSKFLSLILRHNPAKIGLKLDDEGWANVEELLTKAQMDMATLEDIVSTNDKKRFKFNDNKTQIRASQGHSISVNLNLEESIPPHNLMHGTATRFVPLIKKQGLIAKNRQYVHLSDNYETAIKVGERHGRPIVFVIDCKRMIEDGHKFYRSDNNVWLTENVPTQYLEISQ